MVERTVKLAMGANWWWQGWSVIGNGGVHLIHNAGHVAGANKTRWVGKLSLRYHLHTEAALP